MRIHATSTFTVDSWDGDVYDQHESTQLARATLTKTFQGDFAGTSSTVILTAQTSEGSAAYVGLERLAGTLHGRGGGFVLHHSALSERGVQTATWTVVPDSGTGDLLGLRGEARIDVDADGGHTLTLDYELDAESVDLAEQAEPSAQPTA